MAGPLVSEKAHYERRRDRRAGAAAGGPAGERRSDKRGTGTSCRPQIKDGTGAGRRCHPGEILYEALV